MKYKIPAKDLRCHAPVYRSVAELVNLATNHPELVRDANYSDHEYLPEDKLDAIDHIVAVLQDERTPIEPFSEERSEFERSNAVDEPASESTSVEGSGQ